MYKKTTEWPHGLPHYLLKAFIMIKLSFVLLLVTLFQANALTFAQKVNIKVVNAPLGKVFNELSKQTGYSFLADADLSKRIGNVSVSLSNVPINKAIEKCFSNIPVAIILDEQQRTVFIREKALNAKTDNTVKSAPNIQQHMVSGLVRSSDQQPMQGVSVTVRNRSVSGSTDSEGNYRIAAEVNDTLTFSFVGHAILVEPVRGRSTINVSMTPIEEKIEEVVVIGYGTQSKKMVTGAISTVDLAQTRDLPNTNITEAMRGRVAGVQFTPNGRPGQSGNILIRGPRSLSGQNNPLIVLDGIFFNGSMNDINPNDIQSIDILKDASAAAIYGSRAANGVVLITSKSGKSEKTMVSVNTFAGFSSMDRKLELMGPEKYIQRKIDYLKQSGQEVKTKIEDNLTSEEAKNYLSGHVIDPWKEASQTAGIRSIDVSISGRPGKTSFYNSASYTKEKGLIYNDNQTKITVRSNIENQAAAWLKLGMTNTFVDRDMSGIGANLNSLYYSSPFGNWYHEDGFPTQFSVPTESISGNPVRGSIMTTNKEVSRNLFSNFYGIIEIPQLEGLSYRINYSPNFRWEQVYNAVRQDPHLSANTTSASKFNQNTFDYVVENILTYKKRLGEDHNLDVTLLYGYNKNRFESTTATANQLSTDALGYNNLSYGQTQLTTSNAQQVAGVSSMGRINYHFKDRYLVTLTGRRDGSSVFAKNNKYATFPSASFTWIASEENFLKNVSFLNLLKLRLSYGAVGNQAIQPYQSISLSNTNNYVYGNPGTTSLGVFPLNMANDNLKWETTYTTNLGIDFGLFNNRLSGSIELYNSDTEDLLVSRLIPAMTGYTRVQANLGATNNKGVEVSLSSENIQQKDFSWSTNLAVSMNRNKIVHLYGYDANNDGKEDDDLLNNWFIGQSITSYYDYVFDGIYQEGDEIPSGSQPGFVRLKDLDGDGTITPNDRKIVGSGGQAKFRGSLTNTFRYKNFTLSMMFNTMLGWQSDFILLDPNSTRSENSPGRALNQIDVDWWTPENRSNSRPSLTYTNSTGHNWYVSRNFVRLQDISLGYNFPESVSAKLKLNRLRVYASAKNLFTWTDYPGSDPEVSPTATMTGVVPVSTGTFTAEQLKANMYPLPRTISVGINVGF